MDFKPGKPRDGVAVPIPLLDRGRGDPQNFGMIVHSDRPEGRPGMSLRSALTVQSASGGQGCTKCNCSGPPQNAERSAANALKQK